MQKIHPNFQYERLYLVLVPDADKDPDVQPIFRTYIENVLVTSELKILKKLKQSKREKNCNF